MPFRTTCLNTTSRSRSSLSPSPLTHTNRASKLWWHKQKMTIRNTSGMHVGHYTRNILYVLCFAVYKGFTCIISLMHPSWENEIISILKTRNPRSKELRDLLKVKLDIWLSGRARITKSRKYIQRLCQTKTEKLEGFYYEDHYYLAGAPVKYLHPGPPCTCGPVTRTVERGPGNANRHQGWELLI